MQEIFIYHSVCIRTSALFPHYAIPFTDPFLQVVWLRKKLLCIRQMSFRATLSQVVVPNYYIQDVIMARDQRESGSWRYAFKTSKKSCVQLSSLLLIPCQLHPSNVCSCQLELHLTLKASPFFSSGMHFYNNNITSHPITQQTSQHVFFPCHFLFSIPAAFFPRPEYRTGFFIFISCNDRKKIRRSKGSLFNNVSLFCVIVQGNVVLR